MLERREVTKRQKDGEVWKNSKLSPVTTRGQAIKGWMWLCDGGIGS